MIVAAHQPDFLPYSGFWYKLAKADVLDLRIYDQFQSQGYQRRVLMRENWASLRVVACSSRTRICDVRIQPGPTVRVLLNTVRGRYQNSRNWTLFGPAIMSLIEDAATDLLWQFNFNLILGVRQLLDITTPISISPPPTCKSSDAIIEMGQRLNATDYLSGTGGRAYMGDCAEFHEAGIAVQWSTHAPATGESILSVLMDEDDPQAAVLAEHQPLAGAS